MILFKLEDDPGTPNVDESEELEIVGDPIVWDGAAEESPVKTLDPDTLKPGKADGMTGSGSSAVLDIDKDSDRFYIKISGGAKLKNPSIKIETVENSDTNYDDGETELDLEVNGDDLISKSLLLVSDDIDDDHMVDNIADNAKNDRTHKIQLSGKLQIKSINVDSKNHEIKMKSIAVAKKKVEFEVVVLKVGGTPVVSQSALEPHLKAIQERFAQVGILASWTLVERDPPTGVNLSDGLQVSLTSSPSAEELALFNGLGTSSQTDMQIYILNDLDIGIPQATLFGLAYMESLHPGTAYVHSVVINGGQLSANLGRYTIAHEIGHILTNAGHYGGEDPLLVTTEDKRNLMATGGGRNTGLDITGGRRLQPSQESSMQNHSLSKQP